MCLERDPCLLDWREAILCLDIFLGFSSLFDDVVDLRDFLRVIIRTIFYVIIFNKAFNFSENIVDWSDRVIVNLCYLFFEIAHLTR